MMLGSYNPYKNRRVGRVPGPSLKPKVRNYRVTMLFNQRELFLGVFAAFDRHHAIQRCKEEINGTEGFNLIATEEKA